MHWEVENDSQAEINAGEAECASGGSRLVGMYRAHILMDSLLIDAVV